MKPLKLIPAYKDYLWGGNKLEKEYGKKSGLDKTAESWELSVHPDGPSVIAEGEFAGMTLADWIARDPSVLGTARTGDELPILVKLIDAADDLSVQVHPDDAMALTLEGQHGKTEMWYVMEADPGAQIVFGVKQDTDRETFARAICEDRVGDLLNRVDSLKGDVFFVDAGTIHAIGKGNLIAEIQQNSNVTYRLYDYGRRDRDGNLRPLHVEKGKQAANLKALSPRRIPFCSDGTRLLGSCSFFQVKERKIQGLYSGKTTEEHYLCLMCVDGFFRLDGMDFSKGETLFFPAEQGEYSLQGTGTVLEISDPPRYYVGVDLGGTNIVAAVVDEYGVIYGRASRKTNAPRPYSEVFDDVVACVRESVTASGLRDDDIVSVGIGCPGAVNKREGTVEFSNNLEFYHVPVISYLTKALGKQIYMENDANAAAWGEFLAGSGAGASHMVMLTLGTGVGGGVVIDGALFTGAWGKGAELGHTLICKDGEPCTCGRKGCLEAYASATALIRQTKEAMKTHPESALWQAVEGDLSNVTGKTAFLCPDDPAARQVVEQYTEYLAEGVVDFVNIFQPETVVLGGGVSRSADRLIPGLQKALRERGFARFGKEEPRICAASLGNDAGIIGAALLWKNKKITGD